MPAIFRPHLQVILPHRPHRAQVSRPELPAAAPIPRRKAPPVYLPHSLHHAPRPMLPQLPPLRPVSLSAPSTTKPLLAPASYPTWSTNTRTPHACTAQLIRTPAHPATRTTALTTAPTRSRTPAARTARCTSCPFISLLYSHRHVTRACSASALPERQHHPDSARRPADQGRRSPGHAMEESLLWRDGGCAQDVVQKEFAVDGDGAVLNGGSNAGDVGGDDAVMGVHLGRLADPDVAGLSLGVLRAALSWSGWTTLARVGPGATCSPTWWGRPTRTPEMPARTLRTVCCFQGGGKRSAELFRHHGFAQVSISGHSWSGSAHTSPEREATSLAC